MNNPITCAGIVVIKAHLVGFFRVVFADGTYQQVKLGVNPTEKTVRNAAATYGLPVAVVWKAISLVATPWQKGEYLFPIDQLNVAPPLTAFRLRSTFDGKTVAFASFNEALVEPTDDKEYVIEWDDIEDCCAVDLDYHAEHKPEPGTLESRAWRVQPAPAYWWITRNGGLRLIYHRGPQHTAQEYGAVAAIQLVSEDNRCTVELLTRTRRPGAEFMVCTQTHNCDYLRTYMGSSSELVADDWLSDNGYEVGMRYPHTRCPVNPSEAATKNPGGALVVHPTYIKCYICERDGILCGSRDPGYFPVSALAGSRIASKIKRCVDNFTHWGHAKYIFAHELSHIPAKVSEVIYRAMLRLKHGNDIRIPTVFVAGEPNGVVRRNGYWASHNGQPLRLDKTSAILAGLPVAQNQLCVPIPARVEMLAQPIDLSPNGYPAVSTIWGCRLTQNQTMPSNRICVVVQPPELRPDDMTFRRARYLQPSDRELTVEQSWRVIEDIYPLINRQAVMLLMAAKGCTELKAGLPPMVFMTGPTGVGKTSTAMVAAAICGDTVRKIPYSKDQERLFAAIRGAKDSGSFASFDEFLKGAKRARLDSESAMELILDLNEDAMSHMLYVGPVVLGDLPVLVWTDTLIPPEVKRHQQIGRRMHHLYLGDKLDWEESLARHGIRDPSALRLRGSREQITAANVILSDVIDNYFPAGVATDFAKVAADLGFKKLKDCDVSNEYQDLIRQLFNHVCNKTGGFGDVPAEYRTRWAAPTWRFINLDFQSDAASVAMALLDKGFASSRIIEEHSLKDVLGLKENIICDIRAHGYKVAMRFRNLDETKVNEELLS